ncbi:hypothetical protein AVEN_224616-1, partial [Araneus ventricosus]
MTNGLETFQVYAHGQWIRKPSALLRMRHGVIFMKIGESEEWKGDTERDLYDSLPDTPFRCKIVQKRWSRNL